MSLPNVAVASSSSSNGGNGISHNSTSFRENSKSFSPRLDPKLRGSLSQLQPHHDSAKLVGRQTSSPSTPSSSLQPSIKASCRRTFSSPISRQSSSSSVTSSRGPHRKFGETRLRWRDDNLVENLDKKTRPVGFQNVAKAKMIGRNWRQKQQLQPPSQGFGKKLTASPSLEPPSTSTSTAAKKKYKKKHSLSSPSLGKYSPLLLRKVFQQQKESQLAKFEPRPEDDMDDFFDETLFSRLWASETRGGPSSRLHGEERTLGDGGISSPRRREAFVREDVRRSSSSSFSGGVGGSNNFLPLFVGTPLIGNNSCSLASVQEETAPVVKKKKKSIIATLSLGQKDFPKKFQQNLANVNSQIWNRRQVVKKSRQSIASFSSVGNLISEPIHEETSCVEDQASGTWTHCSDRECCCHSRKSPKAVCSLCHDEDAKPRKKSSLLSLSRLSAKRQHPLKRNMLVGKTTVRMNSEPVLGRQSPKPKQQSSLSTIEAAAASGSTGMGPSQPTSPAPAAPRTGLIPRRDFGPAAGNNHRAPMLKLSRGSWISKPTEENPTENTLTKKLSSILSSATKKSSRRHSAPPTSSRNRLAVAFTTSMSVAELLQHGTFHVHMLKVIRDKQASHFLILFLFGKNSIKEGIVYPSLIEQFAA